MQKVVSISLNGNSYQLEEPGYEQLRAYLDRAESRLKESPDRSEVMADLEQAIGEKCRAMLGPHKTVVNTNEVERIIGKRVRDGRTEYHVKWVGLLDSKVNWITKGDILKQGTSIQ